MDGYVILAFALGALSGMALGYLMGRPRKVRPVRIRVEQTATHSEALARFARQSGENAARAVS